jgi:hypothetical protein
MGNDELIDFQLAGRGPVMNVTVYAIFGIRVSDETDPFQLEEEIGQCLNNGEVGAFWAGARDKNMTFLARSWDTIPVGEYVFHHGEKPNMTKFERDHWNDQLRSTAERLGLTIVDGPGWFTIPSES